MGLEDDFKDVEGAVDGQSYASSNLSHALK
jgi:hypothetical protein